MTEEHWKKGIKKKFFESLFGLETRLASYWVAKAHRRLMWSQWYIQPNPEWFNHNIDLYYQWKYLNINSFWVERGVFNAVALKGKNVLELSSGDGFNAKHFYSRLSESVIACDFDPTAIKHSNKYNSSDNVKFVLADIRTSLPEGKFENIIWDQALEHFTEEEIENLMPNIKSRLTIDGILSGNTIVEKNHGHEGKMLHQHEYEFKNKEDLERFFKPYFKNINVFELFNSGRHNLYFWVSDGEIPFDDTWKFSTKSNKK